MTGSRLSGGSLRASRAAPRGVAAVMLVFVCAAGCGGSDDADRPQASAPAPTGSTAACGTFRIAYDPSNGYEASAFIVGAIAQRELHCDVEYVRTTSRNAWRLVARGDADVYLDAYGNDDLRARLTRDGGPVNVVGPNGVRGGVDLLAPTFMGEMGLDGSQDLDEPARIGWGATTPAITAPPELLRLAHAVVTSLRLDYVIRNAAETDRRGGMRVLLPQPRIDDGRRQPSLYLVEAPRALIGDGVGRHVVDLPESAADGCVPDSATTLCSLANFRYQKIVNADFAKSESPAYALVYKYELSEQDAATIEELVQLSGIDVGEVDVSSWLNTHMEEWRSWLGLLSPR